IAKVVSGSLHSYMANLSTTSGLECTLDLVLLEQVGKHPWWLHQTILLEWLVIGGTGVVRLEPRFDARLTESFVTTGGHQWVAEDVLTDVTGQVFQCGSRGWFHKTGQFITWH